MVVFKKAIPRRTFVRGVGATLALPMLDAMTPAFAAATRRPIRMAFMQVPNGIFNLRNEETPEVVGACESAYGCAYYNTISWRNETTPLPMENRPRAVFERLFGDAGADPKARLALRQEDRSILDAINAEVKRLRIKVGGTDRGKIDQYLEAIREDRKSVV